MRWVLHKHSFQYWLTIRFFITYFIVKIIKNGKTLNISLGLVKPNYLIYIRHHISQFQSLLAPKTFHYIFRSNKEEIIEIMSPSFKILIFDCRVIINWKCEQPSPMFIGLILIHDWWRCLMFTYAIIRTIIIVVFLICF